MKILFVYPRCPDTFWGFRHALPFISKKAGSPPLGLLTVAAMLPGTWEKRLVDMNVQELADDDIKWADYVFLSAMSVQQVSARATIRRCKALGIKVVVGGPLFTASYDEFIEEAVDHFVLGEAEVTLPKFLNDLSSGTPKRIYKTSEWADIHATPIPLWDLIDMKHYATMNLQFSRGCPYNCEFCDITVLYGRQPRTKTKQQIIAEFESLYAHGWRGHVFLVDDNFIGNKKTIKRDILPAMIEWMRERNTPITLSTEASINMADDDELLHLMASAGFNAVFIGIETPNEDSLIECGKANNRNRDLISSIHKIQRAGMEVIGGFIVGFDNDPPTIFDKLPNFIQASGITTAMVGLLNAPRGTLLYKRMQKEGRLLSTISGDNTDSSINFKPKMNYDDLLRGYQSILRRIYVPKHYYARARQFLKNFEPARGAKLRLRLNEVLALVKSTVRLGVFGKERYHYWKLLVWSLFRHPRLFPNAVTLAIYGFHFRKVFESQLANR